MRGQWQAVQKLLIILEASLAKRRLGWPVTESCRSGPDVLPKRPEEGRDGCRLLNGTSNDNCSDSVIGSLARFTIHPWLSTHRRYDRAPLSCRAYLIGPNPDSDQSGPRVSSYWPGRWTTSAAPGQRAICLDCRGECYRIAVSTSNRTQTVPQGIAARYLFTRFLNPHNLGDIRYFRTSSTLSST